MTRAERDAALAIAAERYVDMQRLQRTFMVNRDVAAAVRLQPKLNDAYEAITRLVDVVINPDRQPEAGVAG